MTDFTLFDPIVHGEAQKLIDAAIAGKDAVIADLNKQIADLKAQIPPPPPPPPSGWPDATNTGVPAGTVLKPYSGSRTITIAGTVLDGYDLSGGQLFIKAANVTLRNCLFKASSYFAIRGEDLATTGLVIDHCKFVGPGKGATVDTNVTAIVGRGTFTSNDISAFENGITLNGGPATLRGNYIHDLADGGAPHYDGIEVHGGNYDILIEGNNVVNGFSYTSAVFIKNDNSGGITNITVRKNRLVGGSYTVYADNRGPGTGPMTGISFTDNVMGRGQYGYSLLTAPGVIWSGNTDMTTGAAV